MCSCWGYGFLSRFGEADGCGCAGDGRNTSVSLSLHGSIRVKSADLESVNSRRFEAFDYEGRFYVNPGSATGAWSGLWNGWAKDLQISAGLPRADI